MNTQTATETDIAAAIQPQLLTSAPAGVQRIVLTGFMGAGKSTIGPILASRFGWTFLDLDAHLEQRVGLSVPEIFDVHGEARFRRFESTALTSALSQRSSIIALGGGTPESLTNRLLLEQTPGTFIVFLDAPFPTLFDRCVLQGLTRPILADPDAAHARFTTRHPLYTRLAGLTIDTSSLTPHDTVDTLLAGLSKIQPRRPY